MKNTLASNLGPMPVGWYLSGSSPEEYLAGIDKTQAHSGSQCASLVNGVDRPDPSGFATIVQEFSVTNFIGKRVKMSAWLKTKDVQSMAALWLSVYGTGDRVNLSFDNMCNRQVTQTTDWTQYSIVLDVPVDGTKFGFGVILSGVGQVWVDDFNFEEVGTDFEVTDCPCSERRKIPWVPVNLNFE